MSYTNKFKSCSLYLWLQTSMYCADDQFSKPFMMLLMSLLKESKYYIHVMEKHFNKELFMTKDCEILRALLNENSIVKILGKYDFNYLSQQLDGNY